MTTKLEALTTALIAECERAMKQRDEFRWTGVSTAAPGQSHDTIFGKILRDHRVDPDKPVDMFAIQALRETQNACDVSQCPWCGRWGASYAESGQPVDYCHHEYSLTPWQSLWPNEVPR